MRSASGTRELVHVLQGRLIVAIADETVELAVRDAASFPGDRPHSYANPRSTPIRFSLAVYEPVVGLARTARS